MLLQWVGAPSVRERQLEVGGTDPSHQRAGASSSIVCPEVISEEASGQVHLDQIGQHDSCSPP